MLDLHIQRVSNAGIFCYSIAISQMHWSDEENDPIFDSIDEDETIDCATEPDIVNDIIPVEPTARKRGRKQFITARLVAALDNAKVSDGMAVHILIAAAEALGHRVEEYAINRTTIHRLRQENRSMEFKEISKGFSDNVNDV